jgi:hypothetical protein
MSIAPEISDLRSIAVKPEFPNHNYTLSPREDAEPLPPVKPSRFEEVEEAYVPATDMENSALAPAGLSNPFWN